MKTIENVFYEKMYPELESFKLEMAASPIQGLAKHFVLLKRWSEVHNLTAVSNVSQLVSEHYMDCILALSLLNLPLEQPVYDLGSGNGFPGLIAAILYPKNVFYLVESSRKKCSFLRYCTVELGLPNVKIFQERVESFKDIPFAITRAAFSKNALEAIAQAFIHQGSLSLMTTPALEIEMLTQNNSRWKFEGKQDYVLSSGAKRSIVTLYRP